MASTRSYARGLMAFVAFVVVLAADRWLKRVVSHRVRGWTLPLLFGLALTHARHIVRPSRRRWAWAAALIACGIAAAWLAPADAAIAYAVAVAGAASNGIDEAHAAGVVNTFSFCTRVAFNIADIAIVAGVGLGLFAILT